MRNHLLSAALLFTGLSLSAQKMEVINPSGFTHNYVIGDLKYLETLADTTWLNYIASLHVSAAGEDAAGLLPWNLIQTKAKTLGANTCYLLSSSVAEGSLDLVLKLFFAGENVLKANALKQITNAAYIFNQSRYIKDSAVFYLDEARLSFAPDKYYRIPLVLNEKHSISVNRDKMTSTSLLFKKVKKARFFILPDNKRSVLLGGGSIPPVNPGPSLAIKVNGFYELDYDRGRLMIELLK